ncbi:MAG: flagellar brake protein [Lachnospiraceae bacterium]|nr:flagellar brake protein [Lachnospiraceae bacterium]
MENIIKPGDKLEIRIVQQVEMNAATGEPIHVYKSSVEDVLDEDTLEIDMPIEGGRVLLLPLDVRYEFIFFSGSSLYRAKGVIVERYRRDNIYMLKIAFKTPLAKYQRREYYRYPCLIDIQFALLDEEEWNKDNMAQLFADIAKHDSDRVKNGRVLDLSGGGMRFSTLESLQGNDYLLIVIRLCNDTFDKKYAIPARLIASDHAEGYKSLFHNRVQFVFRDIKMREEIIRFIFEEERSMRRKNTL